MSTVLIVDAITGEEIERDLTPEELADIENVQAEVNAREAESEAQAKARASALAKLKKLGLTDKEIAAL